MIVGSKGIMPLAGSGAEPRLNSYQFFRKTLRMPEPFCIPNYFLQFDLASFNLAEASRYLKDSSVWKD